MVPTTGSEQSEIIEVTPQRELTVAESAPSNSDEPAHVGSDPKTQPAETPDEAPDTRAAPAVEETARPAKKRRRTRSRSKKSEEKNSQAAEEHPPTDEARPDADSQPASPAEDSDSPAKASAAKTGARRPERSSRDEQTEPDKEAADSQSEKAGGRNDRNEDKKPARRQSKTTRKGRSAAAASASGTGRMQMVISYIPGEECRVAVTEDGKLEEFHAERASSISRVGNIYVGRVTNVEPAIQAAFVDFGVEHHGFLHVSDVHPRYFPGEDDETTESVGKKTPRRERPPIQRCFRRGDEVLVQVLKEGVGTKGPTLTSYLSVPGRFLVMMPQMDRVGVSRKVEDEDQRREMRQILDQLDLPEGFGFILRTAGMERTKQELKRDLAYLMRLWKDMETRREVGHKPRLLYSESDLLVRALRDMLAPEIDDVIIDNELALARAARFLKIVAPRSKVGLLHHTGRTPLFHAFGIEQQISLMHAREVPLPSGGRLVIDETEALVAIDVNSGKMRDSRDAETNAYRTNCEAVEEICRQLKLRDLGGIVINDLIDMRLASHRKDIEHRFRERLKRDRARSTILPISNFGILEMTRQRMRGSHETVHFSDCPTCRGRGIVQKPDSVASDALRNLAALLDHEKVARVEMVVSPRVASELLSSRRKTLNKLERASGKHVDVRVSETIPIDRITFYAYDATNADIEIDSLPKPRPPRDLKAWELPRKVERDVWVADLKEEEPEETELTPGELAELEEGPTHPIEIEDSDLEGEAETAEGGRKRRRRRRRRGRGADKPEVVEPASVQSEATVTAAKPDDAPAEQVEASSETPESQEADGRKRRRRRRRRRKGEANGEPAPAGSDDVQRADAQDPASEGADLEAPRGDSWDLPAEALPALPAARPPAETPRDEAATDQPGDDDRSESPRKDKQEKMQTENRDGKDGRSRRRGRGDRSKEPARSRERTGESKPPQAKGAKSDDKRPSESNRDLRVGGGYKKKSSRSSREDAPQPATPVAKPPAKPDEPSVPPAAQPPEPGSGQPAKPKRVLYSTRRKLTPAELAKRPKPE